MSTATKTTPAACTHCGGTGLNKPICTTCGGRGEYRPPYGRYVVPCEDCAASRPSSIASATPEAVAP